MLVQGLIKAAILKWIKDRNSNISENWNISWKMVKGQMEQLNEAVTQNITLWRIHSYQHQSFVTIYYFHNLANNCFWCQAKQCGMCININIKQTDQSTKDLPHITHIWVDNQKPPTVFLRAVWSITSTKR